MAGECKFEMNFWKFPTLGYQQVLLLYYLWMWEEMAEVPD
jgi:hypothetical protein